MPRRHPHAADPHPLARRIAARRRARRQSLGDVATALSSADRPRSRQIVHAWERGALPRPCDLPALATWMGEDVVRVRRWRRQQLDHRQQHAAHSMRTRIHV